MKGSYSVPTGSRRSPLIECESPSADSRMNRFISAMPSSICWPCGEKSQLKVEGMRSRLKVSAMTSRANSPRRFTQGPRLVDTVTSGEVVTMRRAKSSLRRREFVRHRDARRLQPARRALRERHGVEECLQTFDRCAQSLELVPFVPRPHVVGLLKDLHLRRRHQPGVVVLVAGERQAVTLDSVTDEAGRPVGADAVEGFQHGGQIMAA